MNSRLLNACKTLAAAAALTAVLAGPASAAPHHRQHRDAIPAPALIAPATPDAEEALPPVESVDEAADSATTGETAVETEPTAEPIEENKGDSESDENAGEPTFTTFRSSWG